MGELGRLFWEVERSLGEQRARQGDAESMYLLSRTYDNICF